MKRLGPLAAAIVADIVADIAFRRKVERLHARGPRAVAEVFAELGARHSIQTTIDQTLDRHLAVPEEALEATGGDQLPPTPLHAFDDDDVSPNPVAA